MYDARVITAKGSGVVGRVGNAASGGVNVEVIVSRNPGLKLNSRTERRMAAGSIGLQIVHGGTYTVQTHIHVFEQVTLLRIEGCSRQSLIWSKRREEGTDRRH
jgi:hypothetical protein